MPVIGLDWGLGDAESGWRRLLLLQCIAVCIAILALPPASDETPQAPVELHRQDQGQGQGEQSSVLFLFPPRPRARTGLCPCSPAALEAVEGRTAQEGLPQTGLTGRQRQDRPQRSHEGRSVSSCQ